MDIQETIKERFKVLPMDIREAITSTDLSSKFETISQKHGLRIDQSGSLQTETLLIMLGLESPEAYVDNLQKELEISRNEAMSIAKDVNTEILDSIRESLRKIQADEEGINSNQAESSTGAINLNPKVIDTEGNEGPEANINKKETISSIEHAGDFTIENTPASSSPQYKESDINKDELLKQIEGEQTVPLVDHLLTTPVNNPDVQEVKKVENKKAYSVDPYRESI